MNKKRIILVCASYPPETGAAPGRMYHLAQLLYHHGYAVTVLSAMPNYPTGKVFTGYRGRMLVREQQEGIDIIRLWMIPTHTSNKLKRVLSTLSYSLSLLLFGLPLMRKLKPQLAFVSSPPFATGTIGSLIGRLTRVPVILNISDIWPKTALELGFIRHGILYRMLEKLEQRMYHRAVAFSAQAESIIAHIRAKDIDKPFFVYRNLQPVSVFAGEARPEGTRKIVYAGLLGIAQGVSAIVTHIDFAAQGTELHIYGDGYERDVIRKFIADHPGRGVTYHGSFPAAAMPELLSGYHAMLVPLSTDISGAVPSKIFAAMAHGLPVLFCGAGEASELVQRYGIGLVSEAGEMNALEQNIMKMAAMDNEEYETMRQACIRCGREEFSKQKQDASFLKFIGKIVP